MSTTTISRYLNGKKKITNEWVNRFCNYYHVDKKWLENGSGEPVYISFLTDSEIKKSSNAGKRLVQLRSELGLKQEDVYIILGITRAMYSRIENGHAGINTEYAKKIEDHFGIGSEWLLYGDESKKYYPVSQKLVDFLWSNIEERKRLWLKMRD